MAVSDERFSIGDSYSGVIVAYADDEVKFFDVELASGASLIASAAAVLATASLL